MNIYRKKLKKLPVGRHPFIKLIKSDDIMLNSLFLLSDLKNFKMIEKNLNFCGILN